MANKGILAEQLKCVAHTVTAQGFHKLPFFFMKGKFTERDKI
jgi:hypothetical protein